MADTQETIVQLDARLQALVEHYVVERGVERGEMAEKLKANMQEVSARGGQLYVFADGGSAVKSSDDVNVLMMPEHYGLLSPVLHVVALQLLSYHVALVKGTDVDKPRNLAKSVTVE
ncbi:hypothetical protein PZ78_15985 [Vreelandella venusta]|nr:hypothetical protein PZ78_15985 [Halomonas hydrothermalis]